MRFSTSKAKELKEKIIYAYRVGVTLKLRGSCMAGKASSTAAMPLAISASGTRPRSAAALPLIHKFAHLCNLDYQITFSYMPAKLLNVLKSKAWLSALRRRFKLCMRDQLQIQTQLTKVLQIWVVEGLIIAVSACCMPCRPHTGPFARLLS